MLISTKSIILLSYDVCPRNYQLEKDSAQSAKPELGSESANDEYEQLFISYAGQIYDGRLKRWLSGNNILKCVFTSLSFA